VSKTHKREVALLVVGVTAITAVACSRRQPSVPVSAQVHLSRPEEDGKFVEVCFTRALVRGEAYDFELELVTRDDRPVTVTCRGIWSNSFGEAPSQCSKFNLFVYCLSRHSPPEAFRAIENYVRPGNVNTVTMQLYRQSPRELLSTTPLEPK
jgi:hypothetical protein